MIDETLHDLTIKHNKILETLGEKDDRSTVDLDLEEYVDKIREHAIVAANGNMAKAAELLGQEPGVIRQWKINSAIS